jgi:uncharacterized protein (TIGR03086 family)
MSEEAIRYATVASAFSTRVDGVQTDRWDRPTPCADWSVRDLVIYVIDTHSRVLANVTSSQTYSATSDASLAVQWRDTSAAIAAVLDDEDRAATVMGGMFGEQSFASVVGRLLCSDTLIHTWDLARATGQDESLDPQAVAFTTGVLESAGDAIRRPGGFGPRVTPSANADAQNVLLAFCGRTT